MHASSYFSFWEDCAVRMNWVMLGLYRIYMWVTFTFLMYCVFICRWCLVTEPNAFVYLCLLYVCFLFWLFFFFFLCSIIDTVLLIKSQNLIANSSSNVESSNNNNSNYSNNNHRKLFKQQTDDHVTASILSHKTMDYVRRNSYGDISMILLYF